MINNVKKDKTYAKAKILVDKCPLFDSLRICHPVCNWWNGTKCTYPTLLYRKASH